jgi:hypothetical protein
MITDPTLKHKRYNASPKGKDRKRSYVRTVNDREYLERRFIAWDGEGGNETDGSHTYFLLASSAGFRASAREGLSTVAVFNLFLNAENAFRTVRERVTHIGYGLNYDINMILRDMSEEHLTKLYRTGKVEWYGYYVEWRPGKSFAVRRGDIRFLLYDVLPFFQRKFTEACDEYLGSVHPMWSRMREQVMREKARRGQFDWSELDSISDYNDSELSLLVELANELRLRLHRVGIKVSRWDGPGAIAGALYKKYETKSYKGESPNEVARAARFAYAGGRFEIIRKGHSVEGAFQYDIRSAYPSAARYLPCLKHGYWSYRTVDRGIIRDIVPFGIYRIEVVNPATASVTDPQPLWMRNRDGTVHFSEFSHGWYWSPEAQLANDLGGITIHEAWEWNQECEHEPFHFVEPLYLKRAALKKAGDGAHIGLKLGLNSLYGKLAQQVGWGIEPNGALRLPPYHCLEWAGWITSHCRSQVYRATLSNPHDIIAFETDAVFSRKPLSLTVGEGLGEWEATEYASLTYLKSGMYFGTYTDGREIEKSRGINKGTITREQVIEALHAEQRGEQPILEAEQTRFVGLGQAIHQGMHKWRRWYTNPRNISVALSGKRIDLLSTEEAFMHLNDGWYETQEGFSDTEFSYEYPIAWINPNPDMAPEGFDTMDDYRTADAHGIPDE